MFLVIFFVVFCLSRTTFSQSMSMYGCRELRNVTFLNQPILHDLLFLKENDPCINYHIYDRYAKKIIPYNQRAMERVSDGYIEDVEILHRVQLILDESNSANNNLKQTLVLYTSIFDNVYTIHKYLERLQNEKKWDIIVVCDLFIMWCVKGSWIPANRIFLLGDRYYNKKYLQTLVKNPEFDLIKWYKTTTPDNYDKSCTTKQETVVNIVVEFLHFSSQLVQSAIAIDRKNFKFKFFMLNFYLEYFSESLNTYLKRYNINNKTISTSGYRPNHFSDINEMLNIIFMFLRNRNNLNDVCSSEELVKFIKSSKNVQIYRYHDDGIPINCKGKKSVQSKCKYFQL